MESERLQIGRTLADVPFGHSVTFPLNDGETAFLARKRIRSLLSSWKFTSKSKWTAEAIDGGVLVTKVGDWPMFAGDVLDRYERVAALPPTSRVLPPDEGCVAVLGSWLHSLIRKTPTFRLSSQHPSICST